MGLAGVGFVRRWRGGRSPLGATVNRIGTDLSTSAAAATEEVARQAGSLAGTTVSITGSVVVSGASLVADGVVTLVDVATGPSRHLAGLAGRPDSKPGPAPTKKRPKTASKTTSKSRRPPKSS